MSKLIFPRSLSAVCVCQILALHSITVEAEESPQISDNSFLIEEAYNQEAGVVQHISSFFRQRGGAYLFSFTQEFPLFSEKHQLSYTIPAGRNEEGHGGIGDIFLNYRYQLVNGEQLALAPRLSLLLPTGDERRGLGFGGPSIQLNLPLSAKLGSEFAAHTNAGLTYTPRARGAGDARMNTLGHNLGQSIIWLAHPRFNVLIEAVWFRQETVTAANSRERRDDYLINPGVRWSYNFANGLQIVPGIAFPIGVGSSSGQRGVFFYLSFEHPFTDAPRSHDNEAERGSL